MAKTQFNKIEVVYVVAIKHEKIKNMFTGQIKDISEPTGEQHIFEVTTDPDGGGESLVARSFCGRERTAIAQETGVYKIRQPGPVCQACQEEWKKDPRSPWAAWASGTPVGSVKE